MTYYEKLINSPIGRMVEDYVSAIEWARDLSNQDWHDIVCGEGSLEKFVYDVLSADAGDPEHFVEPTCNKYTCNYARKAGENKFVCERTLEDCNNCGYGG